MKNKIILLLIAVTMTLMSSAQIKVIDVSVSTTDISAVTQKRTDLNGKACALVKVEMASPQAMFQGNIVGEVAYSTSEYWVYVSPGTKQMKIMHPEQSPLLIDFPKYGISQLEGGNTYSVKLQVPSNIKVVDVDDLLRQGIEKYHKKEYEEAFDLYNKAASYNSPEAMFILSIMTENGYGTKKDSNASNNWCRRAAELGYPQAQYNMGVKYFEGEGVLKDMSEGVKWFEKGAYQGEPNSMYNLGISHEFGYGTPVDLDEAEYWYCKAVENNIDNANKALERVQSKITPPESEFKNFSLFCVKGNNTYCFSPMVWKSIPESKKKYYDKVGIFMTPQNQGPFIFSVKDEDREIAVRDAIRKFGEYMLTIDQAKFIEKNAIELIKSCVAFDIEKPSGAYWAASKNGDNFKGLVFAANDEGAVLLNLTDSSVAAVRPIINVGTE